MKCTSRGEGVFRRVRDGVGWELSVRAERACRRGWNMLLFGLGVCDYDAALVCRGVRVYEFS